MSKLRAVSESERGDARPETIFAAAQMSERALLVALRDKLAKELDSGVPAHAVKGIASELRDIDRSIRLIDAAEDEDGDVIAGTDDEAWNASAI